MKLAYLVFIATTIAMSQQDAQSVANLIKVRQLTLSLINRELTLSNSFQAQIETKVKHELRRLRNCEPTRRLAGLTRLVAFLSFMEKIGTNQNVSEANRKKLMDKMTHHF